MITGCNSGIGNAIAHEFYMDPKFRVVITARARSLQSLHSQFEESDRVLVRELDITNDSQISTLASEVYRLWRGIDIVVNNAGISYRSVVEHMDEESEMHQLKTNYTGPMALIRAVLPAMRERGYGHIINVSSVSGMMAMPTMGSYSASKAALQSASESLWYELKPFGVKVSVIQPGFVNSNSFQKVYLSKKAQLSEKLDAPYSAYYHSFAKFVERLMSLSHSTPEQIAHRIYKLVQMKNPPLWVPVTLDAYVFQWLRHLLPHKIFHLLMFKMLPNPPAWLPQSPVRPTLLRDA